MTDNTVVLLICACISSAIALISSTKWIAESARADRAERDANRATVVARTLIEYMDRKGYPDPFTCIDDDMLTAFIISGGMDCEADEGDCA